MVRGDTTENVSWQNRSAPTNSFNRPSFPFSPRVKASTTRSATPAPRSSSPAPVQSSIPPPPGARWNKASGNDHNSWIQKWDHRTDSMGSHISYVFLPISKPQDPRITDSRSKAQIEWSRFVGKIRTRDWIRPYIEMRSHG